MKTVSQEIARVTGTALGECDKHNIVYAGKCPRCKKDQAHNAKLDVK